MIRLDHSMDFVTTKLECVSVELVMTVRNVINVHLATMDILGVGHVPATTLEVNQTIVMTRCVVVTHSDSVNAR